MALFRVGLLPDAALDASARFHAEVLPKVQAALAGTSAPLTLIFAPADHTHRGWRLAVVQGLARACARQGQCRGKRRRGRRRRGRAWLAVAEGVTGQLLPLDGTGAGKVI